MLLMTACILLTAAVHGQTVYEVEKGNISFSSDAPKELISAGSDELKGLLDPVKKTFYFKIPVSSFMGFNSPLQQEHFRENYMETGAYPEASFKGKIVDEVDLSKPGTYAVRAKGKLAVHGIESERIIDATLTVQPNTISISAAFAVLLQDHNIKIPRVVIEKLASEIKVSMKATLKPRNK